MALFQGIQEYIALDANNIFLYPPQGIPILCIKYSVTIGFALWRLNCLIVFKSIAMAAFILMTCRCKLYDLAFF